MRTSHIPERRCVGCGRRAPKAVLARFVVVQDGVRRRLVRDPDGTAHGRGIYVCARHACADAAMERRGFHRHARLEGAPLDVDEALFEGFDR